MSLRGFHILFVVLSVILSLGFSVWGYFFYQSSLQSEMLYLSISSLVVSLTLSGYLLRFAKKTKGWIVSLLFLILSQEGYSCAVCYGKPDDPLVKAANSGVLVLLAVISFVLIIFASIFIKWAKKASHLNS